MKYVMRVQNAGVVEIPEGSVGIRLVAPGERERDFRGSAWLVAWLEPVAEEEEVGESTDDVLSVEEARKRFWAVIERSERIPVAEYVVSVTDSQEALEAAVAREARAPLEEALREISAGVNTDRPLYRYELMRIARRALGEESR